MERILFATDKAMNDYIAKNCPECETRKTYGVIDSFTHDDSMRYIGDVSGECSGVCVENNGMPVAYFAYWESAGDYRIEANGEIAGHADHLAMARSLAEDMANNSDDWNPEVYILCPDGDRLRWDER